MELFRENEKPGSFLVPFSWHEVSVLVCALKVFSRLLSWVAFSHLVMKEVGMVLSGNVSRYMLLGFPSCLCYFSSCVLWTNTSLAQIYNIFLLFVVWQVLGRWSVLAPMGDTACEEARALACSYTPKWPLRLSKPYTACWSNVQVVWISIGHPVIFPEDFISSNDSKHVQVCVLKRMIWPQAACYVLPAGSFPKKSS